MAVYNATQRDSGRTSTPAPATPQRPPVDARRSGGNLKTFTDPYGRRQDPPRPR